LTQLRFTPESRATDNVLEQRLFGRTDFAAGKMRRVEPDWAALACELKLPGVSMIILWEEQRQAQVEG
jgi:transposase